MFLTKSILTADNIHCNFIFGLKFAEREREKNRERVKMRVCEFFFYKKTRERQIER